MTNYKIMREETVFKTPRMEGIRRTLATEDGSSSFTHTIIHSEPSVAIIVRKQGKIALIRQLRSTTNCYYWEIPAGLKNLDEDSQKETAIREVREETGLLIKDVEILVKGPSLLDPSKSDENFGVAVATAYDKKDRCLDENERIDSDILWMDEQEVFTRLKEQMSKGTFFYDGLHMSGHSIYALLAYQFLCR